MTAITVTLKPDPSGVEPPWVAEIPDQPPARGRSADEAVRHLLMSLENKKYRWDETQAA
jgi:hypothetical protein